MPDRQTEDRTSARPAAFYQGVAAAMGVIRAIDFPYTQRVDAIAEQLAPAGADHKHRYEGPDGVCSVCGAEPVDPDAEAAKALRMLVEGRYAPDCRDRSTEFADGIQQGRQWTVWLTLEQHARFTAALEAIDAD